MNTPRHLVKPSKPKVKNEVITEVRNNGKFMHRILIGTPTLGQVRIEWHNAMSGVVIPCNWSNSMQTPIGFMVDDAQNIIANEVISQNFEWMLLLEDDVMIPSDLFIKLNKHMEEAKYPIVSGIYLLKSSSPEPLMYRGRGNGPFTKFKMGEKVQVDGVPTGCLLVHVSILKALAKKSEFYELRANDQHVKLKKIFWTPRMVFTDVSLPSYQKLIGTSDLWFCDRILKEGILKDAGWPKLVNEKHPFLVDTSIQCGHIDRNTGSIYGITQHG